MENATRKNADKVLMKKDNRNHGHSHDGRSIVGKVLPEINRCFLPHTKEKPAKHPESDWLKCCSVDYKRKAGYLASARSLP